MHRRKHRDTSKGTLDVEDSSNDVKAGGRIAKLKIKAVDYPLRIKY